LPVSYALPGAHAAHTRLAFRGLQVLSLLALLVQKYEY
jgi:hypothetical protein